MGSLKIGIVGGTGVIGHGIATGILQYMISADQLWVCNRSKSHLTCENSDLVHYTTIPQQLVSECDVVILAIRPADFANVTMVLHSQLLISVMAGVSIEVLSEMTQATAIVRAMPNSAVEIGQSFTPWYSRYLSLEHQQWVRAIFSSTGVETAIPTEKLLDYFTALTGSGHGLLAAMAAGMQEAALAEGVTPALAEQAVRCLFSGVGQLIAHDHLSPKDRAQACIDYAGTTAAGINGMRAAGLNKVIRSGIEQAYLKAQSNMMQGD